MKLRHLLPALLALLLHTATAPAQTRAVVANPTTGALTWPTAADFITANSLLTPSTLTTALGGSNASDNRAALALGTGDSPAFAGLTVGGNSVVTSDQLASAEVSYAATAGAPSDATGFRTALGLGTTDTVDFGNVTIQGDPAVTTANLATASVSYATSAGSAGSADSATYATSADNATYATYATSAAGADYAALAQEANGPASGTESSWRSALSVPQIHPESTTAPESPVVGDIWFHDNTVNTIEIYTPASTWVTIGTY